jgi:hypothetical protein
VRDSITSVEDEDPLDVAAVGLVDLAGATVSVNTNTSFDDYQDINIDLSILVVVAVSRDSNTWVHSKDNPSFRNPANPLGLDTNVNTSSGQDSNCNFDELINDLDLDLP